MYRPEAWVPKPTPVEVFEVRLDNLEDLRNLLSATSLSQSYNRNRTILIEWTMMHRETFSALVGEYIVRNERGEFLVLTREQLIEQFNPFVPEAIEAANVILSHPEVGRLMAAHRVDGEIETVLFELPDGTPAEFVKTKGDDATPETVLEKVIEVAQEIEETGTSPDPVEAPVADEKPKTPSPADLQRNKNQKENNS